MSYDVETPEGIRQKGAPRWVHRDGCSTVEWVEDLPDVWPFDRTALQKADRGERHPDVPGSK